jgi:hypothetical protein
MGFDGDPTRWPRHVTVHVPQSAALARLLHSAGPWTGRAGLAAAAEPGNGASSVVTVLSHHVGTVSEEVARALAKAREAGAEGADELAAMASHLGVHEVQPEPEPAPAPAL